MKFIVNEKDEKKRAPTEKESPNAATTPISEGRTLWTEVATWGTLETKLAIITLVYAIIVVKRNAMHTAKHNVPQAVDCSFRWQLDDPIHYSCHPLFRNSII